MKQIVLLLALTLVVSCGVFTKGDSASFEQAFDDITRFEGGYSDQENDATGEVRYGITGTTARKHGYTGSMRKLPLSTAKEIYRKSYWNPLPNNLSPRAKFVAFDAAVNQGVGYAKKLAKSTNGNVSKMIRERRARYRETARVRPDLRKFLKGWMNRMNHVEKTAKDYAS
jgi:lysozyme family protein